MINEIRKKLDTVEKLTLHLVKDDLNIHFYTALVWFGRELCDRIETCEQPIPSEVFQKLENGTNLLLVRVQNEMATS